MKENVFQSKLFEFNINTVYNLCTVFFIMELINFISKYKHLSELKDSKKSPYSYFLLGDFVEYPLEFVENINEFVSDIKSVLNTDVLYSNYEFRIFKSFLNFLFDAKDILNLYPSKIEFEKVFVVDETFMGYKIPYDLIISDENLNCFRNFVANNNVVTSLSGFSSLSSFVAQNFVSKQRLYVNCA